MIYLYVAMACVAALTILLWQLASRARTDFDRLAQLEKCSEAFFNDAAALVLNEDTPIEILERIQMLNRLLADPRSTRLLLRVLKKIRGGLVKTTDYNYKEIDEFFGRYPKFDDLYHRMVRYNVLAISLRDRNKGPQIRELFEKIKEPSNAEFVVREVSRLEAPGCQNPATA